jgi:hypothetical protein
MSPNFHIHVSVSDFHDWSAEDRSWEYINLSHWERDHTVSFLGMHGSNILYNVVQLSFTKD